MTKKFSSFNPLIFLALIVSLLSDGTYVTAATSGRIVGTVIDKLSGDLLPATNLQLEGTMIGASSDLQGYYVISNIPPGTYRLVVTYMGYQKKTLDVRIRINKTERLDIELEHETISGETITVTAQAAGQIAAINEQIKAQSIKNVVSAARIQELPDATAAESIGRLPGVSINRVGGEASTVNVRGLAPRFNNVQLDGVSMKSTGTGGRSTDISMISPTMLAGIDLTKAITPDMEANSLGGTINLTIREAPEQLTTNFMMQGGYDSQEQSYGNYKIDASVSNRFFDNKLGVFVNASFEKRNRGTDILDPELNQDWVLPESKRDSLFMLDNITFRDIIEERTRVGGSLILDYRLPRGSLKMTNFVSRMNRDVLEQNQEYAGYYLRNGEKVNDEFESRTIVSGDNFTTQMVSRLHGEFDLLNGKLDAAISHALAIKDQPEEREMLFRGNYNEVPPNVAQANTFLEYVNEIPGLYFADILRTYRTKRDGTDREYTAQLNYEIPFKIGQLASATVKLGGKYNYTRRKLDIEDTNIRIGRDNETLVWKDCILAEMGDEVWPNRNNRGELEPRDVWDNSDFDNDKYFDGKYILQPFVNLDIFHEVNDRAYNFYERKGYDFDIAAGSFTGDQDGSESTVGTYIMTDIKLLDGKVSLIPGVRYEHANYNYVGIRLDLPSSGLFNQWEFGKNVFKDTAEVNHKHWFPMMHLRVKPQDWFDVRLAYTNTASRPTYNHLTPYFYENSNATTLRVGNVNLKPQLSENWDLQFTAYSNKLGLFGAGIFYKNIENLIWNKDYYIALAEDAAEFGVDSLFKGYDITIPLNSKWDADLWGFEAEWQTRFWYLPFPFDGLTINVNYTYTNSETTYPEPRIKKISFWPVKIARDDTSYTGPIEGMSKNVINLSVGYDYKGFSANLSYLYQDGALSNVNIPDFMSIYTFPYSRWDLKIRQKLPWDGLEFYVNWANLSNEPDERYRNREEWVERTETWGKTLDVGLRYRIQ